ncbi:unnamed protein product, partial [Meganyctiphanes norvegica]
MARIKKVLEVSHKSTNKDDEVNIKEGIKIEDEQLHSQDIVKFLKEEIAMNEEVEQAPRDDAKVKDEFVIHKELMASTRKTNLINHQGTHKIQIAHKCSYCDKVFLRKDNLQIHIRIHTGEKPYQCNHCDKTFRHKGNLKTHQRTHNGTRKSNLVNHQGTHNRQITHKCCYCDKVFLRKDNLQRHTRIHTGEKPYQCN